MNKIHRTMRCSWPISTSRRPGGVWRGFRARVFSECPGAKPSKHKAVAPILLLAAGLAACTNHTGPVRQADVPPVAHALIPVPAQIELPSTGTFSVTGETQIVVAPHNEEVVRIGRLLAGLIGNSVETTPDVVAAGLEGNGPHIRLTLDESVDGDEAYVLIATPESVVLTASAPALYTGTEVGFSFLCVEKSETFDFVEDVVDGIAAVTPGPYFHLGGDEVHELTPDQYAQFMQRALAIVADAGKIVVGWDEIAEAHLELAPGTVIQVWRLQTEAEADAVARGASVILSPADHIYLDIKYDVTTVLGLEWAGRSDVRHAYVWEPAAYIPGVPETSILGVEAPLWSESLHGIADVEYMAFPRLAGVAEIGWSPAAARDWETYRLRLGAHGPRWTALGINFFRAPDIPWGQMRR